MPSLPRLLFVSSFAIAGCCASVDGDAPVAERRERIPDRALVKWVSADPREPWWIEERIAPQPMVQGDRDLGPRAIVRGAPERRVVWQPPETDRLVDACRHPSGEWSAVGVQHDLRVFVARGDASGLLDRLVLDDVRVGALSEASPKIAADGEGVVVAAMLVDFSVVARRLGRQGGAFVPGAHTLVSPAVAVTPILPIGGSYDDFDAVVSPHHVQLGVDAAGRAFVVQLADRPRLLRHNAHFGTDLDLLRDALHPRENTSDALVSGVDRDGTIAFAVVVGTPDFEDEVFGVVVGDEVRDEVGDERVAVLGRRRRELGRDNTELHAMVAELSRDGAPLGTTTFDGEDSAIAQSGVYVTGRGGRDLWVSGTEGWKQNPSGRSLSEPGHPFLVRMHGEGTRSIERLDARLPKTSGHAELRAIAVGSGWLFLGGHENGPLTHTGDADRSLIRSDAYLSIAPL